MTARSARYILGTAGHVDHGKSAIVRALTGTDPDRLPEEKARGITIDLGFASLLLRRGKDEYLVGVIDVPGHEDFVKNMVAGVGSLDAALLVVAADDGWMPQTEEHLQILTYLGVTAGIVALNKIDLAVDEAASIAAVRERLRGTPLEDAPVVATSTLSGRGLDELRDGLAAVLSKLPAQADAGKPRLPVDRVFSIRGVGTVVTGTLTGGCLRRGASVIFQPAGKPARIRAIQTHGRDVEMAGPGSRVALNLPDVQPAQSHQPAGDVSTIARGQVVTVSGLGSASRVVDVLLTRSARQSQAAPFRVGLAASVGAMGKRTRSPMEPLAASGPDGQASTLAQCTLYPDATLAEEADASRTSLLRNGLQARLHHGSGTSSCRVRLMGCRSLEPGLQALARLVLETPLFALPGDRFVIRDGPGRHTLAGGVVLDMSPPRPSRSLGRDARQRALLQARSMSPASAEVLVASQVARDDFIERALVLSASGHPALEIEKSIAALVKARTLLDWGIVLADPAAYRKVYESVLAAVDEHHRVHPEHVGLSLTAARPLVERQLPPGARAASADAIFDRVLGELCRSELVRTGAVIHRRGHRPALPPRLQSAGSKVRSTLAQSLLQPPSRKELCPNDLTAQALRFLIASGEVVDLGPEVVISADAYAQAARIVRDRLAACQSASVSELKECLGSTRRVIVPLLERFDRDGITRRVGDRRVLRSGAPGAAAVGTVNATGH